MSLKIALAGNPNSGKTTLFNAWTGLNQYVGNWPGVTVEKKTGFYTKDKDVAITDLPGIYSLSPYTIEEVVARNYLLQDSPDVIVNIIDGTNLERNLYLTTQLLELNIPVIIAVNMYDIVKKNGSVIEFDKLSQILNAPIVPISALRKEGLDNLMEKAKELQNYSYQSVNFYSPKILETLQKIQNSLGSIPESNRLFYSVKLFEHDNKIDYSDIDSLTLEKINENIKAIETELDDDGESIITDEKYTFIAKTIKDTYKSNMEGKLSLSDKIDKYVTNRFLALPIFTAIMFVVYYISVSTVGTIVTEWTNDVFVAEWIQGGLVKFLESLGTADWLVGLINDGIVAGVGAVIGFLPQLIILFIFLSFLEECGYMSRIAFILDRIFRKFGLSGKTFIPMLISTGCGIPGVMSSRTIESDSDRRMTIMTTTFMPCGAKLPIIALISGALFGNIWWVSPSAYFLGIISVIVSGIMLKKTKIFVGDTAPFVMELPSYHLPTFATMFNSVKERVWSFVKKAGTVILLSSIVIWFLGTFNWNFKMLEDYNGSILDSIGNFFKIIFAPLGFGNSKAAIATITGLVAKENVVTTFGILYGLGGEVAEDTPELLSAIQSSYTMLSAYSFLAFNLLCAPCFAAIGAIKSEMRNRKWTIFAVVYQTLYAYAVALIIYQFGSAISGKINPVGLTVAIAVAIGIIYMMFIKKPAKVEGKSIESIDNYN